MIFRRAGRAVDVLLVIVLVACAAGVLLFRAWQLNRAVQRQANVHPAVPKVDLATERLHYPTQLVRLGPAPDFEDVSAPPADASEVRYSSDGLQVRAWLSKDPGDGKRHPAVVYLHGNFTFAAGHWTSTRPFRDAGFVEMTPMTRGENGNPGNFECFYGEVNDVVAAGEYVSRLPYVDPNRVYLAGHSVGGTLALLVSEMPSRFAAVAAFSGAPDMGTFLADEPAEVKVFDPTDPREMRLRSASDFIRSIRCPLFVFDGIKENWVIPQTRIFVTAAQQAGKNCQLFLVPGDHISSKAIAIRTAVQIFLQLGKDTSK